jgi:hypothetical protein
MTDIYAANLRGTNNNAMTKRKTNDDLQKITEKDR